MTYKKQKINFKEISNNEKRDILDYMQKNQIDMQLWRKGDNRHRELLNILKIERNFNLVVELEKERSKFLNKEVMSNFILKGSQYFTTTFLYKNKDDQFTMSLDWPVYKCERRNFYRLFAGSENNILLFLQTKSHYVLDISIGGLSFIINKPELYKFEIDKVLENSSIEFNRELYDVPLCKISNISNFAKNIMRVGVQFIKLPDKIEMKLNRQINSDLFKSGEL